jgi:hypothetical protein
MESLIDRIQSIRIGKGAPEKISSHLNNVKTAMTADLTPEEMEKFEGILEKVDSAFSLQPKSKKARKSASKAKDPTTDQPRKRTITGYGLHLQSIMPGLKGKKISCHPFQHISDLWRALTDDERGAWIEKARVANLAANDSLTDTEVPGKNVGHKVVYKGARKGARKVVCADSDAEDSDFVDSDSDESIGSDGTDGTAGSAGSTGTAVAAPESLDDSQAPTQTEESVVADMREID